MNNHQHVVAYVKYYLQEGYTEASIRAHLSAQYGWPENALDDIFYRVYGVSTLPKPRIALQTPHTTTPKRFRIAKRLLPFLGRRAN